MPCPTGLTIVVSFNRLLLLSNQLQLMSTGVGDAPALDRLAPFMLSLMMLFIRWVPVNGGDIYTAKPKPGASVSDVCPWIVKPLIVTLLAFIPIPSTALMIVSEPSLSVAQLSACAPLRVTDFVMLND